MRSVQFNSPTSTINDIVLPVANSIMKVVVEHVSEELVSM